MKNLLLVLSLVIIASPAFASRARLESLGENANGSYYINDGRNIFLNPAAINGYKKKLFVELGNANDTADSASASKVQGGFTNTFGDFVYGLYVGRESTRALSTISTVNTLAGTSLIAPDHAFDFFFGGEASSLKYGIDVFYAGAASNTGGVFKTTSMFGTKLGVDVSNFALFTTIGISNKSTIDDQTPADFQELKGKLSLDIGATYTMDEHTFFGKFSTFGTDYTVGTTSPTVNTFKTTAFAVGMGCKKEVSKSVTMYSRVQADIQKNTWDSTVAGVATATSVPAESWYNLPIVLGAEAQATSWLTVRGSISHSLIGQHQRNDAKDSLNNLTTAAMGLGFNFGDLNIDALVGQAGAVSANGASETSQGAVQSGATQGFGSDMLTRLSMTYNF